MHAGASPVCIFLYPFLFYYCYGLCLIQNEWNGMEYVRNPPAILPDIQTHQLAPISHYLTLSLAFRIFPVAIVFVFCTFIFKPNVLLTAYSLSEISCRSSGDSAIRSISSTNLKLFITCPSVISPTCSASNAICITACVCNNKLSVKKN